MASNIIQFSSTFCYNFATSQSGNTDYWNGCNWETAILGIYLKIIQLLLLKLLTSFCLTSECNQDPFVFISGCCLSLSI